MDRRRISGWALTGVLWLAGSTLLDCGVKTASLNELGLARVEVLLVIGD